MKTLSNVLQTPKRPQKHSKKGQKKKNTACLVTYLIATGHHLCLRFPLLVFWAQTRLISRLALIRGHISEHSGASHAACWEKWNAINQSGSLFNVNGQWKQTNMLIKLAMWKQSSVRCAVNKWESAKHCERENKKSSPRSAGVRRTFCFVALTAI